jgi:hypothetical protein
MWKVLILMLLPMQLVGQQIQDPLQNNTKVLESIKSYYFPGENNFAFFLKAGVDYKFDRFYNSNHPLDSCEEYRLILVSKQHDGPESKFIFILLSSPMSSKEITEKNTLDYKSEVLRAVEFEVFDGVVSFESETDFEPY